MKNIEVNPKPSRQLKNIVKSLATFQSAGNVFPYSFFSSLPVILLSIIILDKVLWLGLISKDIFRLSWHITVIAEIYVVNILFEKIIRLFTILHARNVIALTKSNETHFIVFLERFARWLNRRFSHLVGIIFLAVVSIASYPVFVSILSGNLFFTQSGEWLYYYVEELVVVDIVLGYLFGLAFWRLTIITFSIVQFSKNYKIKVRFTHPDKSGG